MAGTPGYSGLLQNVYPQLNQWSVARGRRPSQQMVRGLLGADAFKAKQLAMQEYATNQRIGIEQQRTNILQDQADAQKTAGMVGGVGQLAMLPLAYGAAKSSGMLPQGFQLTSPSTWGGGGGANTAQGLVGAGGATGGATTQLAPSAFQGAGTGMAEGAGFTLGSEAGGGLLSTAAPYAGVAGAGLLGGSMLGPTLDKILPGGGKTGKVVGGAAGGALAGAAIGSVLPGPGTLVGGAIGGIIGGISSLF
jgi:hypothetical protein